MILVNNLNVIFNSQYINNYDLLKITSKSPMIHGLVNDNVLLGCMFDVTLVTHIIRAQIDSPMCGAQHASDFCMFLCQNKVIHLLVALLQKIYYSLIP